MARIQERSKRKPTGGLYKPGRKKRMQQIARTPAATKIDEKTKLQKIRIRGAAQKNRLQKTDIANVLDKKTKKYTKSKIVTVIDNPANRHYARRNIMTKGTLIETEAGKAKITSRPGQDGTINAVLVEE